MKRIKRIVFPTPNKLTPLQAAIVPFLLGPGVLTTMYEIMRLINTPSIHERGLFQFYSATIGDFLILPVTWALMAYYYSLAPEGFSRHSPSLLVISIALGGLVSGMLVYSSIIGPTRDWTLPSRGSINAAGVYHALFMAFMLAVYVLFFIDHWKLLFSSTNVSANLSYLSTLYWYVLDLLSLFMILLVVDTFYDYPHQKLFSALFTQRWDWGVFLLVNYVLQLKAGKVPYNHAFLWIFKEAIWYALLLFAGNVIASHPFLWS